MKTDMIDWSGEINDLRVGDLIKLADNERVIRAKTPRFTYGGKRHSGYYFWFAILRKSWTGKCHTMFSSYDLKEKFQGLIKRDFLLVRSSLELRCQQEIFRCAYDSSYRDFPSEQLIRADETVGVIR